MAERRVAVAFSGGRDSTALLHATLREAALHGVGVIALHVHHGLSPNADAWLAHCEAQCRRWTGAGRDLEFAAHRLTDRPASGESIEAWARRARYHALGSLARSHDAPIVLLAHHRRDQAETFVLQALRGAGVAGLSAMPRSVERDGILWVRPWLAHADAEIDAYVRRHRLKHIDDDSNRDPRFARNRLRLQVWPALVGAFPQAEASLATAADWAQQAGVALDELATLDLQAVATAQGLNVPRWRQLSAARRSNSLRAWIHRAQGSAAPATLVVRLLDELPVLRSARWSIGAVELRLHRGVLRCEAAPPVVEGDTPTLANRLSARRAGRYRLAGWGGCLEIERVRDGGAPWDWLSELQLRSRAGAERFQAGVGRPARSLKKQYQQAGLPAWDRGGPLVYRDGELVFVPGLGLDARAVAAPGQPRFTLRWCPDTDVA